MAKVAGLSQEQRRKFARSQVRKIVALDFSAKQAKKIRKAAGSRFAVESVEFALLFWAAVAKKIETVDRSKSGGSFDPAAIAKSVLPVDAREIYDEVSGEIDEALDRLERKEGTADEGWAVTWTDTLMKYYNSRLPSKEIKSAIKILKGADLALQYIYRKRN